MATDGDVPEVDATTDPPSTRQFEWTATEPPSTVVVEAVADATGAAVTDLPPLYESVEPDALDGLVAGLQADPSVVVRFSYAGFRIRVDADGMGTLLASG